MTLRIQETIIVKRGFCTKNTVCSRSTFYYISGFFVILCFFIPTQRKRARLRSELFIIRCSPVLFFS